MLDEIHHGQQQLPALGENSPASFRWPFPVVNRVIASFHAVRPFKVWQPDSLLKNQAEPPLNFQLRSGNLPGKKRIAIQGTTA